MAHQTQRRQWVAGAAILGAAYACSSTANVTGRPNGIMAAGAGDETSTGGSSNGTGASGGSGGTITVGKGGTAGTSTKGGRGGSSTNGGSAQGGESEAGFGNDFSVAGLPDIMFTYDPEMGGQGGACATVTGTATLQKRPMDVIVSIDNSLSMAGEIQQVQARINSDFAAILEASQIDYRVVLVSRYGNVYTQDFDGGNASDSAYSICIGAPLSTLTCPTYGTDPTPPVANNPPRFYQHSTDIGSNDLWCRLIDSYTTPDPYPHARTGWVPVAPNGWSAFLRQSAYKVFVAITDDKPTRDATNGCSALLFGNDEQAWANQFDTALRALDPAQFQTASGDRNYIWYSIVGFAGNSTTDPTPLTPSDPVESRCCRGDGGVQTTCQGTTGARLQDSANPGLGYQYLSILTGGLRYPSCYTANFNDIFNKIAEGVIEGAKASCDYTVPPANGIVDYTKTQVSYEPGSGSSVPLSQRTSDAACGTSDGFYFSSDHTTLHLCAATCTTVQADAQAKIAIDFGCLGS